jgi:hypothetical protein
VIGVRLRQTRSVAVRLLRECHQDLSQRCKINGFDKVVIEPRFLGTRLVCVLSIPRYAPISLIHGIAPS